MKSCNQPPQDASTSVVFVHGVRSSGVIWENQLAHVRAAGHEAVAVDLPAHGARRHDRFSMDGAFEALDEAVAGLPPGPVAMVGLSLGGYTSLAWAARPDTTDRLVGVLAAGCTSDPKGKPVRLYRDVAKSVANAAYLTRRVTGRVVRPSVHRARLSVPALRPLRSPPGGADLRRVDIAPHQTAEPYHPAWDVVTDALTHLAGRSSIANVRAAQVPLWFVNGARDAMRIEEQRHLAAARYGSLVVIPGAGHDVNMEAPSTFNRVLTKALADFERRA
ncbi:Pimeloyl-ACP methyl ester carboxylesterase [Promicromonospora umidemergens]|uniref:AB hydrolase-1 domain-containing protein n=1 Tax=Promicromonospora umidemergens TaxID=629679 RepID=A0ABP8Y7P6_9MICO|nr:alpha/beta hydrolase [Promicromonospora umidemergens]MCP2282468.1 Pimeloyl-ACP methyl ester carboxylesterase [Promicromonospora umidemergens]